MDKAMYHAIFCAMFGHACAAHEFWVEPTVSDTHVDVEVRVGEHFQGEVFPFEPRAYESAYWIGPETVQVLHTQPLTQRDLTLSKQGPGLHVLAVASFGQKLVHPTLDHFEAFARGIGADAVLARTPPRVRADGSLHETYRRFSKTLVNFEGAGGSDKLLGFQYEWVQSDATLALFSGGEAVKHHPVDLFCRTPDGQVRQIRLRTDEQGLVTPVLDGTVRCLVNAVFLEPHDSGRRWTSDWVSLLLDNTGN